MRALVESLARVEDQVLWALVVMVGGYLAWGAWAARQERKRSSAREAAEAAPAAPDDDASR